MSPSARRKSQRAASGAADGLDRKQRASGAALWEKAPLRRHYMRSAKRTGFISALKRVHRVGRSLGERLRLLGLRLSNRQPLPAGQGAQETIPSEAKELVESMRPGQESQHGRPARGQLAHLDLQAHIVRQIVQPQCQRVRGGLLAAGCGVDFREVQMQLRLAPGAADGRVTKPLRVSPFALCVGEAQTIIGKVVGIFRVALGRLAQQAPSLSPHHRRASWPILLGTHGKRRDQA